MNSYVVAAGVAMGVLAIMIFCVCIAVWVSADEPPGVEVYHGHLYVSAGGGQWIHLRATRPMRCSVGVTEVDVDGKDVRLRGHWIWSPVPIKALEESDE